VLLQEVNPTMAAVLQSELLDEYPHQILEPAVGFRGMGVISKYPIQPTGEELPLDWIGTPQVLEMDWMGWRVTLINFHMQSSIPQTFGWISEDNRVREAQAQALVDFARDAGPLILGGDANATPLNASYHILNRQLSDAWLEAGFGFGHTFPGSAIQGSSRPRLAGHPVPQWLMRIDYIFHSSHWVAVEARTAPFDGVSDHRGMVAELVWKSGH